MRDGGREVERREKSKMMCKIKDNVDTSELIRAVEMGQGAGTGI